MPATPSPCHTGFTEKKHWWLSNRKIADKYIKDARTLIASQEKSDITSALNLLDAALALSPKFEVALELKARSLLYLRRFRDVADMLQDYIPSMKVENDDESGSVSSESSSSSQQVSRERVKLLPSGDEEDESMGRDKRFKCFSVSELKKKVTTGLCKNCDKEGQWRYVVLGQACSHLGLMEDAMVLLQTGKRLTTAEFRRKSISWSDDSFNFPISCDISSTTPPTPPRTLTESETVSHLLSYIKLLLRRRAAAVAALHAGLYSEAVRHFTKILDGRRGAPQGFLAECYKHRAFAYKSTARIADSIADCNKSLALNPTCIQALDLRASLFETIRCLPDCLHDLEHLKLLYNSILRDQKLPAPAWKRQNLKYSEIPGKLCALTTKIQELKQRVASGETRNVDYHGLLGLRRGCSRSELERGHLLLVLRHKPDKAVNFVERCELADERDADSVKDRAKMSALLLYRLIQKGYSNVMATTLDEEAAQKHRKIALQVAAQATTQNPKSESVSSAVDVSGINSNRINSVDNNNNNNNNNNSKVGSSSSSSSSGSNNNGSVFQGAFCRDLASVGSLLSQVGFNPPIPLKYEALSC